MIIATKTDFENLLNDEEHKEEALKELQKIQDFDDRIVTRAVKPVDPNNPESDWITEEIENPNPLHLQKGFEAWMDIAEVNAKAMKVTVNEILKKYPAERIAETGKTVVKT